MSLRCNLSTLSLVLFTLFMMLSCSNEVTFSWPDKIPDIKPLKNDNPTPFDRWKEARLKLENPELVVGAAIADLTPSNPKSMFIAGYMPNKKATGLGGPITGRVFLMDDGKQTLVMISLDFIGYQNDRVWLSRNRISKKFPDDILIASTHTHAGPDTMGLWGAWAFYSFPTSSGLDEKYMSKVEKALANAVFKAAANAKPATLYASDISAPDGISENAHMPGYKDDVITILQARDKNNIPIATVVNYACHAEFLGQANSKMHPDFPGYLYRELERLEGGVSLFFNGAIGGIIVPAMPRRTEREVYLREMGARRAGVVLASYASKSIGNADAMKDPKITLRRSKLDVPIENDLFHYLAKKGILTRSTTDNKMATEVWRIDIGSLTMLSVPGEIFPSLGFLYKEMMPAKYKMIIGLSNDELGYIMTEEEWEMPLYAYERTVSPGKQTGILLSETVKNLFPDSPNSECVDKSQK